MHALSTMPQKSVLFLAFTGFVFFSFLLMFFQGFHAHWMNRTERAARARLYLKTDVCTDHRLRIKLGPEATCAQKELELRLSPFHRAVFDTLEDYSLCGHRRCEAMLQWVMHWKWLFLAVLAGLGWCYVQFFFMTYHVEKMRNFQHHLALPGSHSHVD